MKLTFSRDSALLWLALAGVVLTYFAAEGNPMLWHFEKWVAFGIMLVTWGIGKLQSSPLDSHQEVMAEKAEQRRVDAYE